MVKISMPNFRIYLASSFGCLPIARRSRSHHSGPAFFNRRRFARGKAGQIRNPNRAVMPADDEMVCPNRPVRPQEHPRKTGAADPRKGPGSSGLFHQLSLHSTMSKTTIFESGSRSGDGSSSFLTNSSCLPAAPALLRNGSVLLYGSPSKYICVTILSCHGIEHPSAAGGTRLRHQNRRRAHLVTCTSDDHRRRHDLVACQVSLESTTEVAVAHIGPQRPVQRTTLFSVKYT
jgi:hypothetical protein